MKVIRKITDGIYLVIDPVMERSLLLSKLSQALKSGIAAVQLWDNWPPGTDKCACITAIAALCKAYHVPLFIDNDWELLLVPWGLDGVHFDRIPENYNEIKMKIGRPFLAGITCSGDVEVIRWAHDNRLDYVSFCAMFPSPSAGSCNIVMPATVNLARELTDLPLFVSGGIRPDNIRRLRELASFDGAAVISGIMGAADPKAEVKLYKDALNGI